MARMKKQKFTLYYDSVEEEYDLTQQQTLLFSRLYKHCEQFHKGWYCGLSNENLAKMMKVSLLTIKKDLKVLKDKGLIEIVNSGTKMRKIYISSKAFVEEEPNEPQTEVEKLNAEIKRLQERLKEAEEKAKEVVKVEDEDFDYYLDYMVKNKIIGKNKRSDISRNVLRMYRSIEKEYGLGKVLDHIAYISKRCKKAKDLNAYLMKSAIDYRKKLATPTNATQEDFVAEFNLMNVEVPEDVKFDDEGIDLLEQALKLQKE